MLVPKRLAFEDDVPFSKGGICYTGLKIYEAQKFGYMVPVHGTVAGEYVKTGIFKLPILAGSNNANMWYFSGISRITVHCLVWCHITHTIHVRYIHLHLVVLINVGKYSIHGSYGE